MSLHRFEELFPEDLQDCLNKCPILVLPFGTLEWHSYHLPLGLDGIVAQSLCERIAEEAEAVLAPVSYWAVGGVPYPYTLQLPSHIIEPLLITLFEQFTAIGFQVIVAFTGHFGLEQTLTLKRAALTVMQRSSITILPVTEYDMTTDLGYKGDHAATGETSLMLALHPNLVKLNSVSPETPLDGILGTDPRKTASAEKGEELFDAITSRIAEVSLRLLRHTSPMQRIEFIEALSTAVRVLEDTLKQRNILPKESVPSVCTPAYVSYCEAIYQGNYRQAKAFAEQKLQALSQ